MCVRSQLRSHCVVSLLEIMNEYDVYRLASVMGALESFAKDLLYTDVVGGKLDTNAGDNMMRERVLNVSR